MRAAGGARSGAAPDQPGEGAVADWRVVLQRVHRSRTGRERREDPAAGQYLDRRPDCGRRRAVCVPELNAEPLRAAARGGAAAERFQVRLRRDHRGEQRLRPHLPQEHDRADAEGRQEDRARCHAGPQRHQLVFDDHAHPERKAGPRDRVDLGGAGRELRQAIRRSRHHDAAVLGLSAAAAHLRAAGRPAGRQDRPCARGVLHRERHQYAGAEGVRRQAQGARAEGPQ